MVDLMIARVETQLKAKDMAIELTTNARKLLARRGFDPVLGARPLRRTIQREIEDALSEKILDGEVEPGQIVLVDVVDFDPEDTTKVGQDKAKFTFKGQPKPSVTVPDTVPASLSEE
jgi:ATP-dependent Clp protease ATP-binding subunit ClpC